METERVFKSMTSYTQEFRDESVRLVQESGRTVAEVARELGVQVWTLRGWIKKAREKQRAGLAPEPETLEQENRRLRREVAQLRQEREILKKATAYFAKEQL